MTTKQITLDEDGLIIDLPFNWRVQFDKVISRYEWGLGMSVYFAHEHQDKPHIGIYISFLMIYMTIDLWKVEAIMKDGSVGG